MKKPNELLDDLAPQKFGMQGVLWTTFLKLVVNAGIIAYKNQVIKGQRVSNMID